jgi:GNAT superfamily N-acetyltransferase
MSKVNALTYSVSKLQQNEWSELTEYLLALSPETQKRFSPHPFDNQALKELYLNDEKFTGYIVRTPGIQKIIAYAVIRTGCFEYDKARFESYGLTLNPEFDCNFAPSVADAWQGMGIGKHLLDFIIHDLKIKGVKRMLLWGGVQKENENAVKYYLNNGFTILGEFSWHGQNYDMSLDLNTDARSLT